MASATDCALLVAALALPIGGSTAQDPVPLDSVARLIDLWNLPRLTPGVTCRQFASTDPSGQGDDHGHFLRRDGDRCVLAEMQGPGVIVRLWSANAAGRLRVFVDGEDVPRLDEPFRDLFTGRVPPFVPPIAMHVGGGWISYLPIPYARSCRVEVAELEHPEALYYQVQYLTLPAATPVRSFTIELPDGERAALQRVRSAWRAPHRSPIAPRSEDLELRATVAIDAGDERELLRRDEPGTGLSLRIRAEPNTPAVLRGLCLLATFDGTTTIQAPLGDLGGGGFGPGTSGGGLGFGCEGGDIYLHLPMPFTRTARFAVRNRSGERVRLDARLRVRPGAPAADMATLHAEFRSEDGVGDTLYEFVRSAGPGKFVGIAQALQGVGDLWYLEGNEQFHVDGEARPSILGTGTEDFYNGGWYWQGGTFEHALFGLGQKEEWTSNRTTPCRLLLPDAVPFERSLVGCIEHGSRNAVRDAYYSSVAFWYGPPRAVRAVADTELALPRQWRFRSPGWIGAAALAWQPAPQLRRWEELSATQRGLERPLFQAFPVSYVEHDGEPIDARLALLAGAVGEQRWRTSFDVPFADRWRLDLRFLADVELPEIRLDGRPLAGLELDSAQAPVWFAGGIVGGLAAGRHSLEFARRAGAKGVLAFDGLRLTSGSPFVRDWWIAPPVPAGAAGTVEDVRPEEERFLADGFDPAAAGWREVEATNDGLDLNREVSAQAPMLAYLLVFVRSPDERTARVLLGSDDGVRVWCNGELCHSHEVHRPVTADEDRFDVRLRTGVNRLLVKVANDYGGYGVMLRIADVDGRLGVGTAAK
ncbi:MAG: DUF2961 domain-containing protein [Planctomycetes bacterium]|nr:DUF2961 domain-containing protein [Planctomycetota bacterium]